MRSDQKNYCLLLVDDDPEDHEIMREAIKIVNPNITIKTALNAKSAIEILNKDKETGELPDMLLLDMFMPGNNGLNVLKIIKSDEVLKEIPVIVLSSSSFIETMPQLQDYNVAALQKGNTIIEFVDMLKKILPL